MKKHNEPASEIDIQTDASQHTAESIPHHTRSQRSYTSSPSLIIAADYKGGGVASPHGVLDIWHGTDHKDTACKYLARHGSTRSWHGTGQDIPELPHDPRTNTFQ